MQRTLTSNAMAMVISIAHPAMPPSPMRCSVRRPALSTTNNWKTKETSSFIVFPLQIYSPISEFSFLSISNYHKDYKSSEKQKSDGRTKTKGPIQSAHFVYIIIIFFFIITFLSVDLCLSQALWEQFEATYCWLLEVYSKYRLLFQ